MKVGEKKNRLTLKEITSRKSKNYQKYGMFECECGKVKEIRIEGVKSEVVKSCGCYNRESALKLKYKHGEARTRLYHIWNGMRLRCYNKNEPGYKGYGARGILIFQEWYEDFLKFKKWAIMSGYQDYLTIERKNTDGNYSPSNCIFATMKEQCNNRRNNVLGTAWGETKTISSWSEDIRCKVTRNALYKRIHSGWELEKAILTPSLKS